MAPCGEWCATKTKREFHWTRLLLRHKDWETLAYSPWIPHNHWQIVYLAFRWFFCLYFLGALVTSGIVHPQPTWPTYLSNWGLVLWFAYLLTASLTCTFKYAFHMYRIVQAKCSTGSSKNADPAAKSSADAQSCDEDAVDIYSDWRTDSVAWYQKVQWILYNVAAPAELGLAVLYWCLLYSPDEFDARTSINAHLIPAIVVLLEVWIFGIVLNFYHVYMIMVYGIVYSIFTVIFWGAGGMDYLGRRFIYNVLDFSNHPGLAAGILIGCSLVFFPVVYFLLYGMSLIRRWLALKFREKVLNRRSPQQ